MKFHYVYRLVSLSHPGPRYVDLLQMISKLVWQNTIELKFYFVCNSLQERSLPRRNAM
jgi:hypothetical protein